MKEIKFRAWDKIHKLMINFDEIESIIFEDEKVVYIRTYDGRMLCDNEFELMQSISRKDKNNQEIYEGDIIKADCGNTRIYKIIYVSDKDANRCGFYSECLNEDNETNCLISEVGSWNVGTIIIGNIYETREMLNDK